MKPIFTAENYDWDSHEFEGSKFIRIEYAANVSNRILEKLMEEWPVVYGTNMNDSGQAAGPKPQWFLSIKREDKDTHVGRIAFIEELPKEPCKHEPEIEPLSRSVFLPPGTTLLVSQCKHCGVELEADWKEKK